MQNGIDGNLGDVLVVLHEMYIRLTVFSRSTAM